MPAIDIGGNVYRTLADPIYLEDGRQVKEVWIRPNDTGTPVKVYPEGHPGGKYVCKGTYNGARTRVKHNYYDEDGNSYGVYSYIDNYIRHNYCYAVSSQRINTSSGGEAILGEPTTIDLNIYSKFETPWNYDPNATNNTRFFDDDSRTIIGLLNSGCLFHAHFDIGALTDEEREQLNDKVNTKIGYEATHRHLLGPTSFEDYYYTYNIFKPEIGIFGFQLSQYGNSYIYGFIYDFSLRCRYKSGKYDEQLSTELTYFTGFNTCFYRGNNGKHTYKNWTETYDSINRKYVYTVTDPPEEAFYADMPSTDL
jgi:hypothetical protein